MCHGYSLPGSVLVLFRTVILQSDVTKVPFQNLQAWEQIGILKHYALNADLRL